MRTRHRATAIAAITSMLACFEAPEAHSDAGPKSGRDFAILAAAPAACCLAGLYAIYRLARGAPKKVPVTAVLFDYEKVQITVRDGVAEVSALLEYRNTTGHRLAMDLYFPFAAPVAGDVKDISVLLNTPERLDSPQKQRIDYHVTGDRIDFDFAIEPRERVLLHVSYVQTLRDTSAQYVITTIRGWKRPVGHATFTVKLPPGVRSPQFSFPDRIVRRDASSQDGAVLYEFQFSQLFPNPGQEFWVRWD